VSEQVSFRRQLFQISGFAHSGRENSQRVWDAPLWNPVSLTFDFLKGMKNLTTGGTDLKDFPEPQSIEQMRHWDDNNDNNIEQ
jgi:hypothetical protein